MEEGTKRFTLPLALLLICVAIGVFRLGLVDSVAPGVAFAAPLLVCGVAVARALRSGAANGFLIAALLVCTALAAEIAVNQGVRADLPPAVEVSRDAVTRLDVPDDAPTLDVFVIASVSSNPGARGSAKIELSRAGRAEVLDAGFSRAAVTTRSGRRSRVSAGSAHDEERFRVKLPGQGPVSVRLLHVSGSIGTTVRVSAAKVPPALPMAEMAIVLAGLGIVLWDAFQRDRAGRVAHLSGGAAAFALYLERWFSPNDAVSGVMGAAIVAVIGAVAIAIATALLGRALTRVRPAVRLPASGS